MKKPPSHTYIQALLDKLQELKNLGGPNPMSGKVYINFTDGSHTRVVRDTLLTLDNAKDSLIKARDLLTSQETSPADDARPSSDPPPKQAEPPSTRIRAGSRSKGGSVEAPDHKSDSFGKSEDDGATASGAPKKKSRKGRRVPGAKVAAPSPPATETGTPLPEPGAID